MNNFIYASSIYNCESANVVVPLIIELVQPRSVVDVGCGIGTWLSVFESLGVDDLLGIDGDYVRPEQLLVDYSKFLSHDLSKSFKVHRTFDLAICLEVAEHLPEDSADQFIDDLIKLAPDIIFSAALKGQGGQGHVNEQDHFYWQEKFNDRGYCFFDLIRPQIWENQSVNWWYAQNMFLVSKNRPQFASSERIRTVYHPRFVDDMRSYYEGKQRATDADRENRTGG